MGLLAIGGCLDPVAYPCTTAMQCTVDGLDGTCHGSGWCIYPDSACPSGQRFGPAAGNGLADDCADTDGGETTTSNASESGTTESGASESSTGDPCGGIVCDDPPSMCHANPGTCDDGDCTYDPLPVGSECDDGVACTIGDTCGTTGTCEPGPECVQADGCATGVCTDGACVFTPAPEGMSCGVNVSDRCCGGVCVDISSDAANCGGCGTACPSDEACESVGDTPECDPHPAATSGRCTCSADTCPNGQVCRSVTPVANRCAPEDGTQCASGVFQNVETCPNYCIYGTE